MTRKQKAEMLLILISEQFNEGKVKEIKTELHKTIALEDRLKENLSREKQRQVVEYSDQTYQLYSKTLDYNLRFAVNFILEFYNL